MSRLTSMLSMALAAQLVVTIWVFWPQQQVQQDDAQAPLLSIEAAAIERLIISDTTTSTVIQRQGDAWVLPEFHQLPADQEKVDLLLNAMPALAKGWPVAQTEAAMQRFEVASDNYQRKLEWVANGEVIATAYLGTAPGFRKVHARTEGSDKVYAITFNAFDIPAQQDQWLDQTLLQLSALEAVKGIDYELARTAGGWQARNSDVPLATEVDKLVNGLQNLRVSGVVNLETATILRETPVPPTLEVRSGDLNYEYRLYAIDDAYYVKRADIDIYFEVSALDFDRLNEVNATSLYPAPVTGSPATATDAAPSPATDVSSSSQ